MSATVGAATGYTSAVSPRNPAVRLRTAQIILRILVFAEDPAAKGSRDSTFGNTK